MTTVIRQDDLIESVADALQFISYYHPKDFIQGVHEAYLREKSQAAKDAMAQILPGHRHRDGVRHCRYGRAVGCGYGAGRHY